MLLVWLLFYAADWCFIFDAGLGAPSLLLAWDLGAPSLLLVWDLGAPPLLLDLGDWVLLL